MLFYRSPNSSRIFAECCSACRETVLADYFVQQLHVICSRVEKIIFLQKREPYKMKAKPPPPSPPSTVGNKLLGASLERLGSLYLQAPLQQLGPVNYGPPVKVSGWAALSHLSHSFQESGQSQGRKEEKQASGSAGSADCDRSRQV